MQGLGEFFRKYSDPDIQKISQKYRSVQGSDLGDKIIEVLPKGIAYETLGMYSNINDDA